MAAESDKSKTSWPSPVRDWCCTASLPTLCRMKSQLHLPRINALSTASPHHTLRQSDVACAGRALFRDEFRDLERLMPVYAHAGIEQRQSCVPLDWFLEDHSFSERNALYIEHGLSLLADATDTCLESAGITCDEIDSIVLVSTSGLATPSLDARLMAERPFRRDVERLPVFGLGCVGGVLGLARAGAMATARPGSRVLFLCVELCGLTFRHHDRSKSNFVATALFGDGAAAAIVSTEGDGPMITASGEHTWPDSLDIMGWSVEDDGLGVVFSRDIPNLVRNEMRQALEHFLRRHDHTLDTIDAFLFHPGGAKVLGALEECLALPRDALSHARETLKSHGNMSAATVLFVLERALAMDPPGTRVLSSLGPGFTAGFLMLEG